MMESEMVRCVLLFFKQKTAYEMRISDWSSDVCSSDLRKALNVGRILIKEVVDAHVEAGVLQELKCDLGVVIEHVRSPIADVTGLSVEIGRLADPLGGPSQGHAVLLGRQDAIAAPLRKAAIAAADEPVEYDRLAAFDGRDDLFVEVANTKVRRSKDLRVGKE